MMRLSVVMLLLATTSLAVSAISFDWKSVACTNDCLWFLPFESCKKRDSYTACAEKCPMSKPLAFLMDGNRRYIELACRTRNETVIQESLAQFENICVPKQTDDLCNVLLKCVHAIRDESKKPQRKEEAELGFFEMDEFMAIATYTWIEALTQKSQIPAKCAALYDKPLR